MPAASVRHEGTGSPEPAALTGPTGSPEPAREARYAASTLLAPGVLAPDVVVWPQTDHKIKKILAIHVDADTFALTARTTDLARHPWMGAGPVPGRQANRGSG